MLLLQMVKNGILHSPKNNNKGDTMKRYIMIIMDTERFTKVKRIPFQAKDRIEAFQSVMAVNNQFKKNPNNTNAAMLV